MRRLCAARGASLRPIMLTMAVLAFGLALGSGDAAAQIGGPIITRLAPAAAAAGGPGFNLVVAGGGFSFRSQVQWNGQTRPTSFVSPGQLSTAITAADIASPGVATVQVVNAPGFTSNLAGFVVIQSAVVLPSVTNVNPSSGPAAGGTIVTITGTNFVAGAGVTFGGVAATGVQVAGATTITATVAGPGNGAVPVVVTNPGNLSSTQQVFYTYTAAAGLAITALVPSTITAGGPAFPLTVNGTGFVNGAVVRWNGAPRTTTFGGTNQLTATVDVADIAAAGSATITVVNPDLSVSNGLPFTITGGGCTVNCGTGPIIDRITPDEMVVGAQGMRVAIYGANFVPGAVVLWNDQPRTTLYGNPFRLIANIPVTDLSAAGEAEIAVRNPDGNHSNHKHVHICPRPGCPHVDGHTPEEAQVGGAGFTLTVTGQNLLRGSRVHWNGSPRQTTWVNNQRLLAIIPSTDLLTPGEVAITVESPNGSHSHHGHHFAVCSPPHCPHIEELHPFRALVGSGPFTLEVHGHEFAPGAVVRWNGSPRPTTYHDEHHVEALISAADTASDRIIEVTVQNPDGSVSHHADYVVCRPGLTC